jgi:hypothetical protein
MKIYEMYIRNVYTKRIYETYIRNVYTKRIYETYIQTVYTPIITSWIAKTSFISFSAQDLWLTLMKSGP